MLTLRHALLGILLLAMTAPTAWSQGGRGPGGRGPQNDEQFRADRELFHYLLEHREQIRREVTKRDDGIETLTESDDAEVAKNIQEHVASMYARMKDGKPIHRRDPLFNELFRHAKHVQMKTEKTEKGIKVTESSEDPYTVKLIQAHANVVSLFIKNGFPEVQKNHRLPARTPSDDTAPSKPAAPASPEAPANKS